MRYKAILIDADDTFFDFHQCERNAIEALLKHVGIDDEKAPGIYSAINRACWTDFENGLITQARLSVRRFEELLSCYGISHITSAEACDFYEGALANQAVMIEGALETIERIAEKLPIAVVTNGLARCQHGRMNISPVKQYVKALIISQELGAQKPDPKMIDTAISALGGVGKSDVLMVGDSLNSDMRCAMYAGVDGCWYNPKWLPRNLEIPVQYEIHDIRDLVAIALQ